MKRRPPYRILKPKTGWIPVSSLSPDEIAKLLPIAETLSMLDGNAFIGSMLGDGSPWAYQYLSEAHALYEDNGGDNGWAGEASFVKRTKT